MYVSTDVLLTLNILKIKLKRTRKLHHGKLDSVETFVVDFNDQNIDRKSETHYMYHYDTNNEFKMV